MKFIHIADLHLGKSFHGLSLIREKDQPFWKERFIELVAKEKPDAVVIAGDVYDRSAPGNDAVELLDSLLTELAEMNVPVLMVAGNHDSGTKLAFANRLLEARNVYIAGTFTGKSLQKVTLNDGYGPVDFWLMPYVFPALVAELLGDESIRDYDAAVRRLLAEQNIDFTRRNVIVAHQNVLAKGQETERGGSETTVGGLGEINVTAFDGFDYVALGHIHAAQAMGRQTVRYAGSPLCYHFDELKKAKKGPVIVELGEKNEPVRIRIEQLEPLHSLRELTGTLEEILQSESKNTAHHEYISVNLTDPMIPTDAYAQLKAVIESKEESRFLHFNHVGKGFGGAILQTQEGEQEQPLDELFVRFYEQRTDASPDEAELEIIRLIADQLSRPDSDPEKNVEEICKRLKEQGENA